MFKKPYEEGFFSIRSTICVAQKILLIIISIPLMAHADGVLQLYKFLYGMPTIRADFHQTVFDNQGAKTQDVTGVMQMQRPSKFRWDYNKPFEQTIVGDGNKVWLYDPAFNQVTAHAIDKAIGATPAALLAGNKNINDIFDFKDTGKKEGLEWIEAKPKDKKSSFVLVNLGFKENMLHEMKLHDSYGNTTVIELTHLEHNLKIDQIIFRFTPPSGVDVLDVGS